LNPKLILSYKQEEVKKQRLEKIKQLKQDGTLRFMCFNYSNFYFSFDREFGLYFPIIFVPKHEACEIDYDKLSGIVNPETQQRIDLLKKIPVQNWSGSIENDRQSFINIFKFGPDKMSKYKNMKLTLHPQIHLIDETLPLGFYNFFVYKYNKLYHKIEILCKFPNLITEEGMNIKINNLVFYRKCHHFATWIEEFHKCSLAHFSNLRLESFRLIFHSCYISRVLKHVISHTNEVQKKFRNMVIRKTIEFNLFDELNYPFTRKLLKCICFQYLIRENYDKESLLHWKTGVFFKKWLAIRIKKLQLKKFNEMQLLKLHTPYLLCPFDVDCQFNIQIITFPIVNFSLIYLDF
jgi:hypothetical protein